MPRLTPVALRFWLDSDVEYMAVDGGEMGPGLQAVPLKTLLKLGDS